MSDNPKNQIDKAWENLFDKYNILDKIDEFGGFQISAKQIKEFKEPRLMAKFDHMINLPKIFAENNLAILPITRGRYAISHFDAYHKFEEDNMPITKVSLPAHVHSLDYNNITNEAMALNCAFVSDIIADFMDDHEIFATVSGRMGSGCFSFNINDIKLRHMWEINVENSQIEIDAGFEGIQSLALFEAKRDISEDFLIRQLYYPLRTWQNRISKPVRPIFFVYSNGIYRLYEYMFEDINNYNSIRLVKQKCYSIEDTSISVEDIQTILATVQIVSEPEIPFPQADKFERIINLCELLCDQRLSRTDVTQRYDFDARQTNYYTDAARYLGLLEKTSESKNPSYTSSEMGRRILNMNYKQRQLAFCKQILAHRVFNKILRIYFERGIMPETGKIVGIMIASGLYKVKSVSTFYRRSSSVKGWVNWIVGLMND